MANFASPNMVYRPQQPKNKCVACGKEVEKRVGVSNGFWHLNGYYGLRGSFCSKCYDKVSHDSYGKPEHPRSYKAICKKLGVEI